MLLRVVARGNFVGARVVDVERDGLHVAGVVVGDVVVQGGVGFAWGRHFGRGGLFLWCFAW